MMIIRQVARVRNISWKEAMENASIVQVEDEVVVLAFFVAN